MNHRYRKKPVVVEAFQMEEVRRKDNRDWPQWLDEAWGLPLNTPGALFPNPDGDLFIRTLEGPLKVSWGDWIVRDVHGELYPCKPDIFEKTYEPVTPTPQNMNFGQALELLKAGKRVARSGWNGKGMYLWLLPAATVKAEWCREPHLKAIAEANGGEIEALGSIRMMTADRKVLTGWLASQTDMLSDDWVEVSD